MARREPGVQVLGRLGAVAGAQERRTPLGQPVRHRSGRVPDRFTATDSRTGRRHLRLGLGLGAAVEVDPPLGPVRVLDGDVEAEAPVRALSTTARHGSSGLTTEGRKIKAGDHTAGDVARSAARSNPLAEARTAWSTASQTCTDKLLRLSGWRDLNSRPLDPQTSAMRPPYPPSTAA